MVIDPAAPVSATAFEKTSPHAAGSMAPKVAAACRFVRRTGGFAGIGALEDASRIVAGQAGTRVRSGHEVEFWYDSAN